MVYYPLWAMLVCVLLGGCATPGNPTVVNLRYVTSGYASGITEAQRLVFRQPGDWVQFWRQHDAANPPPRIDFMSEMVLAVFMGPQKTTGYNVEIFRAEHTERRLRILVAKHTPPRGARVRAVANTPFFIAAVPKSRLPVDFVEVSLEKIKPRKPPAVKKERPSRPSTISPRTK